MSEWIQFFIVILTVGSFLYMSRSDHKEIQNDLKKFRETWAEESKELRKDWAEESKEFHGRLVAIETDFKNFMKKEEEKRTQIILDRRN